MLSDLRKSLSRRHLTDPAFGFLLEEDTSGEVVSLACATSSFEPEQAELRGFAAILIRGNRLLTSQRLELTFGPDGVPAVEAVARLLHFIGSRPLVGYYLDFAVDRLDRTVKPLVGIPLPNPRIEVSSLYYDRRIRTVSKSAVDLRFDTILRDLDLPERGATPTPFADAVASGLIYLKLHQLPKP
jgi:DNA polymerase-3 subunit epsilon